MKGKIAKVIELSCLPLLLIFLVLVLLRELNVLQLPIRYDIFGAVLAFLFFPAFLRFKPAQEKKVPAGPLIVLLVALFALFTRLLPLTRSSIPLGYDPGFYKYTMELYASYLPQIPEVQLATWVKEMYPQGLFVLSDVMHVTAGTDAMNLIQYLFPFLGALLVLPVFILVRSLFGQRAGIIASVLYALSYTQYATFTMLYFKNVLGLMFLLLAIYALEKRRDGLMALMFAGLGIFHRPEFLLFALVLVPYFVLHRRRQIIPAVMFTALLILPFWLPRWEVNWNMLSGTVGTAMTNIQTGAALGGGTFFSAGTYFMVSVASLPFALMGAIYITSQRRADSLLLLFVINWIIVIFQLFFFRRFIISLDLTMIILAAVGLEGILAWNGGVRRILKSAVLVLVVVGIAFPTMTLVKDVKPLLDEAQLQAIEWIKENSEQNAYVLATSIDAPWVLGWSGRRVIAPGLFEWNVYGKDEWFAFLDSRNPESAKEFLMKYNPPIYIYYSRRPGNNLELEKFEAPYFQKLHDDGGAVIYKYSGGD